MLQYLVVSEKALSLHRLTKIGRITGEMAE